MLCWIGIDQSMKMRETSRAIDKKLLVNNNQNKGVVSEVRENKNDIVVMDDSQMPIIKSGPFKGTRAEVICNPLGIIGRLNISQNYEQEFNFISMHIKYKIKHSENKKEKEKWYFEFIEMINENQYKFTKEWYSKLTEEQQNQFLDECGDNIYIHQEPFYNKTDFDLLCSLYDKYPWIKPFEFEGINIPLIMGEIYFLRLKHDLIGYIKGRV